MACLIGGASTWIPAFTGMTGRFCEASFWIRPFAGMVSHQRVWVRDEFDSRNYAWAYCVLSPTSTTRLLPSKCSLTTSICRNMGALARKRAR